MIMVVPSSSLLYGLGREMAAIEEDGEKQGAMIGAGQPKITGH